MVAERFVKSHSSWKEHLVSNVKLCSFLTSKDASTSASLISFTARHFCFTSKLRSSDPSLKKCILQWNCIIPHFSCLQFSNLENEKSAHCSQAVVFDKKYLVQRGICTHGQQATSTPLYLPVQSKTCKTYWRRCIFRILILYLYVPPVFGVFLYFARHTPKKQQYLPDRSNTCMIFSACEFYVFGTFSKHLYFV